MYDRDSCVCPHDGLGTIDWSNIISTAGTAASNVIRTIRSPMPSYHPPAEIYESMSPWEQPPQAQYPSSTTMETSWWPLAIGAGVVALFLLKR